MPSRLRVLSTTLVIAFAATAAQAAGAVDVRFVAPERFSDARDGRHGTAETLRALTAHFESAAARHLAAGDRLAVEVLDVDLAGELRPYPRSANDVRVLRGGADWPRLHFRYTLESPGRPTVSGEQTLSDLGYLRRGGAPATEALPHEKRLLDGWFATRFGGDGLAQAAAPRVN